MSDDHSEHLSATTATAIATSAPVDTVLSAPSAVAAAAVGLAKPMYPSIGSVAANTTQRVEHASGIAASATTATPTPTPPASAISQLPGDSLQSALQSPGGNMQVDQNTEYTFSQISESISRSVHIDSTSGQQRIQQQGQVHPHLGAEHQGHMRKHSFGSRGSSVASGAGPNSPSSNIHAMHDSEGLRRESISSAGLAHQAQFTFSSPTQTNTHLSHAQNMRAMPRVPPHHPTQGPLRPHNRSPEYHTGVPFPPQAEEDICMSESPMPDDNDSSKDSVSYYRRDSDDYSGNYPEGGPFQHPGQHHPQYPASPHNDARSTSSPLCTDSESIGLGGVTMPAKSAVLYHAGYNSGRGAVWRFFKVVEARVSGNTDRAECLLCQKRMLGKSADMKKHIILSCPFRGDISSDMQPILAIVRAELENPKKRAKRNSNTPIVMRPDGTFVADANAYTGHPYNDNSLTARLQAANAAHLHHRSPSHPRPGPYDFHGEAHRAKMARHSRDPMRSGQSGSRMEGLGIGTGGGSGGGSMGGPEPNIQRFGSPSNAHSHAHSAMPMPPPGHSSRAQPIPPSMQLKSPVPLHTFTPRHPGHQSQPMMPNMQPPPPPPPSQRQSQHQPLPVLQPPPPPRQAQAQPQQQQQQPPPSQQRSQRVSPTQHQQQLQQPQQQPQQPPQQQPPTSMPPAQQAQPPSRYYPPGQAGPSHLAQPHPLPHGPSPRPGGPPHVLQPAVPRFVQSSGSSLGRLRSKLRQHIPVFGVWLSIPSVVTARMLAAQGFDWACIDMEHSPISPTLMAEMVAAVASSGTCVPIVRVPSQAPEWLRWALDAGAHGIIVPRVETPEEMRNIISLCSYPPLGKRSIGAPFAAHPFGIRGPRAIHEYMEAVSGNVLVIPQIESIEGAANLKAILAVGGMDAVFVGPYNLSASVRASQEHIQDVFGAIEKAAKDENMPIGIYAATGEVAWNKMKDGYTLLVAACDVDCLASSASENLERAKGEASRQYR
ncbi:hypothetical protein GGI01_003042 [Coemansia sp. RSA 376]|nr:hypothetical protein GGI01_003042 [Coemansia sp. RSA 376]